MKYFIDIYNEQYKSWQRLEGSFSFTNKKRALMLMEDMFFSSGSKASFRVVNSKGSVIAKRLFKFLKDYK